MNSKQKKVIITWLILSFVIGLSNSIFLYFSQINEVYDKYAFIGPTIIIFIATFLQFLVILGIPAFILYWICYDKTKKK